jgi:hypothetical protein
MLLSESRGRTIALVGAAGSGKTVLAIGLCRDQLVLDEFEDGILWARLGENPDPSTSVRALYTALTGDKSSFQEREIAELALARALEDRSCLMVIDDVWDPAHLVPLHARGAQQRAARHLSTTRCRYRGDDRPHRRDDSRRGSAVAPYSRSRRWSRQLASGIGGCPSGGSRSSG